MKLKPLKTGEIRQLIDHHVVQRKYTKRLLALLSDQVNSAKMISKFCDQTKNTKPTEKEIEALRSMMKGFRIAIPQKIDEVKKFIAKHELIKSKIDKFVQQPKPEVDAVEEMANSLQKESIIFEKSISKLREIVAKCKSLIKLAKKDPSNPKLMKAYKNLNVSCPDFESLIREKSLDTSTIVMYEGLLTDNLFDFQKIEDFELIIDTINDLKWADIARKSLIRRKISLLKEAVEKRTVFYLDMHTLKNLGRDAFLIENKQQMEEELQFLQNLIKKAEGRVRTMKNLPYKKLCTIKKRMFGCVDVSKEISELKLKFKESEKRREALRSPMK